MLKRIVRVLALGMLAVFMLLVATGCYQKLNGGGWMLSANGEDRATFGLHFDGPRSAARGTYHDHGTGVRFKFVGVLAYASGPGPEEGDCALFDATYTSQDKKKSGSGAVLVIACDEGEPGVNGDTLDISVLSGPYEGYDNGGQILGGNLQGFQMEAR